MEFAIRMRDVTRRFGGRRGVEGISLAVAPGELVGLVGPDGAGKTTLARLAAGVIAPTSGKVEPESRGRVGYLTGRFSLYPELTVLENLRFFARLYGMRRPAVDSEARRLLDWVGLLPFTGRRAGDLSGGMRQKLAFVCAVIHRPPVLILDEPTTAVDPVARVEFWRLLRDQARQGCAVLVTTPYMDEAEHCDRVLLLHEGRALAAGTAVELKQRLPYKMAELTPARGARPSLTELPTVGAQRRGETELMFSEAECSSQAELASAKAQDSCPAVLEPAGVQHPSYVELAPAGVQRPSRAALTAAAEGLPGCRWAVPLGEGVRVALDPDAPLEAPAGYELREVPADLEDVFLWLTGAGEEVPAR
ncbi:ABC-2 type transport system ATP-binding protein [Symbiobacterium terraclitae]|uniref:ABC-2 type transport system ATP-binding protein n=1 Tax=Symbiobacterium terraclitae TaxID=557451 RepID=A0ABS4JUP8_9FIRM|nr:ABC-2 type transport system ATP-binding protein [Symbiobacterium terraclitae]